MNPFEYDLGEILMFSSETYYRMIELYNRDIWPMQVFMLFLGIVVLGLCFFNYPHRGRILALILAATWLWTGYGFLLERYSVVNWYASAYAVLYFIQVILFVWFGLVRDQLEISVNARITSAVGIALLVYAILLHPVISMMRSGLWNMEVFGLIPTPTLVATLGLLIMTKRTPMWGLILIPLLSALVGGSTAWELETYEALAGLIAAIPAFLIVTARKLSGESSLF